MSKKRFKPLHINASEDDLKGNHGIGRYIFLPGSSGRAEEIAEYFDQREYKPHPRSHHLYLGQLTSDSGKKIDVATISSGMGCPSMEIILHELFHLGGKRFLRIGTAGSLQPNQVKLGDLVNAQASVRDESTTIDYLPLSVPAVASLEMITAISEAAKKLGIEPHLHTGTVHSKASFYAREFEAGPSADANHHYMKLLYEAGVLATEMETATLFIQSQLYNHQLMQEGKGSDYHVLCGAILSIVSVPPNHFASQEKIQKIINGAILLGIEAIKLLAKTE